MVSYLLKIFVLVLFSFFIISSFYWVPAHQENFDWYLLYIVIISIIYSIYKYVQLEFSQNGKTIFTPFKLFSFFCLHLLILCGAFFVLNWESFVSWFSLILKILFFTLLPISIILISIWFWKKIISFLPDFTKESNVFQFIISLWIWFFSFISLLSIIGILWFYQIASVVSILWVLLFFSYKECNWLIDGFFNYQIEVDINEWMYLKLISAEFLFLISTLILSVNLISIIRPFPIGWDDLWAYMNLPHLLAEWWSMISFWWMYSWFSTQ